MADEKHECGEPPLWVRIPRADDTPTTWHRLIGLAKSDERVPGRGVVQGLTPIYQCAATGQRRRYGGPLIVAGQDDPDLVDLYGKDAFDWGGPGDMAVLR